MASSHIIFTGTAQFQTFSTSQRTFLLILLCKIKSEFNCRPLILHKRINENCSLLGGKRFPVLSKATDRGQRKKLESAWLHERQPICYFTIQGRSLVDLVLLLTSAWWIAILPQAR